MPRAKKRASSASDAAPTRSRHKSAPRWYTPFLVVLQLLEPRRRIRPRQVLVEHPCCLRLVTFEQMPVLVSHPRRAVPDIVAHPLKAQASVHHERDGGVATLVQTLSLIHISEPTRPY